MYIWAYTIEGKNLCHLAIWSILNIIYKYPRHIFS